MDTFIASIMVIVGIIVLILELSRTIIRTRVLFIKEVTKAQKKGKDLDTINASKFLTILRNNIVLSIFIILLSLAYIKFILDDDIAAALVLAGIYTVFVINSANEE